MKIRPLFVGLLAGAAGIALLLFYMRRFEQVASGGRRIELLAAVTPIQRGKPITDEMLGIREVPQAYVDDRVIRAADKDKIIGLRATTNVPVQQTIAWTDVIASTDEQRDLSSLVQPGNRAIPIRVVFSDEIALIHPGDFVDVIGVFDDTKEATVLLQRVLILATGSDTNNDRGLDRKPLQRASILTLSVSLQEGQLLALAMERGKLTVVVRNPDDQKIAETPPDLTTTTLTDSQKRQAVQSSFRRAPQGPVKLDVERAPR